ncbi:hypothetical protein F511_21189 [Dorcoceras hygrometricum]|uniref:Uncharacterized protein n=1 Tax=Dorcoceras hygrometricum TaxID=472368 RepID=A0A2Z7B438_9LAMI|nr:hypothetical protein F511_21189 [Dorcoceras hygrometricum]
MIPLEANLHDKQADVQRACQHRLLKLFQRLLQWKLSNRISDDESLSLEEILLTLRANALPLLVTSIEPLTKIRELFLRKLLVERQKKYVHGTSFTNIDIMVLDVLAEDHKIVVLAYLRLRRQHQLVWTLPGPLNLFSGSDADTVEFSVFSSLRTVENKCIDLVFHPSIKFTAMGKVATVEDTGKVAAVEDIGKVTAAKNVDGF